MLTLTDVVINLQSSKQANNNDRKQSRQGKSIDDDGELLLNSNSGSGHRVSWLHSTAVERRSLTAELSLSCARPTSDG